MKTFWQKHSLSVVLGIGVLLMCVLSWFTGRAVWRPEEVPYWAFWLGELVIAIQVHILVVFSLVILTKYFREDGSKEG